MAYPMTNPMALPINIQVLGMVLLLGFESEHRRLHMISATSLDKSEISEVGGTCQR